MRGCQADDAPQAKPHPQILENGPGVPPRLLAGWHPDHRCPRNARRGNPKACRPDQQQNAGRRPQAAHGKKPRRHSNQQHSILEKK